MRIWYHGTNEAAFKEIAESGFRPGTYFARAMEDALEFGGPYVFEVALSHVPQREGDWQMRVMDPVPQDAIVRLQHLRPQTLMDYPERRQAVFNANVAAIKP